MGQDLSVISFGAGEGLTDRLLLKTLREAGYNLNYFPVDASQTLLELACAGAEDDDFEPLGIKADISNPVHLVFAADATDGDRLFLMAGHTLGGFDPLDEIRGVAQCVQRRDRLIIDGELLLSDSLTCRNHPARIDYALAPLASFGVGEEDGKIRFEQKRDDRHEGLHLIARHFQAGRDLRFNMAGEETLIQRGERIAMNFQYLYTPESFRWLIEEHGGLKVIEEFRSANGRYIAAVCGRV